MKNSKVCFSRSEVKKQESGWFTSQESTKTEPEVTTVKRVTPKKKNKRISTTKSVVTTSRQMTTSYDNDEEEDELPASTTAITIRKEIK